MTNEVVFRRKKLGDGFPRTIPEGEIVPLTLKQSEALSKLSVKIDKETLNTVFENIEKSLKFLRSMPRVRTFKGRNGKVVGYVEYSSDENVKKGMIVLFSTPPSPLVPVWLQTYVVRDSKAGKKYVKCFKYLKDQEHKKLIEELEKRKKELENKIYVLDVAEKLKVSMEEASRIYKLLQEGKNDLLAHYFYRKYNCDAIIYSFKYFFVVKGMKALEIEDVGFNNIAIRITEKTLPCDSPLLDKCVSDKYTIVVLDDVFEQFEVIEVANALKEKNIPSMYWCCETGSYSVLTILLPKDSQLFKKILAIKQSKLPRELKILLYCEALGLDINKLPEISKHKF